MLQQRILGKGQLAEAQKHTDTLCYNPCNSQNTFFFYHAYTLKYKFLKDLRVTNVQNKEFWEESQWPKVPIPCAGVEAV